MTQHVPPESPTSPRLPPPLVSSSIDKLCHRNIENIDHVDARTSDIQRKLAICLMYSSLGGQVLYTFPEVLHTAFPYLHEALLHCTIQTDTWSLWSSISPNMGNYINKGMHKNFSRTSSVLHPALRHGLLSASLVDIQQ